MASFPWKMLVELREKYTYDIHPFTTFNTEKKIEKHTKTNKSSKQLIYVKINLCEFSDFCLSQHSRKFSYQEKNFLKRIYII